MSSDHGSVELVAEYHGKLKLLKVEWHRWPSSLYQIRVYQWSDETGYEFIGDDSDYSTDEWRDDMAVTTAIKWLKGAKYIDDHLG
jgi:hypothetical protein